MKEFDKLYLSWRKGRGSRRHIVGVLKHSADGRFIFTYDKAAVANAENNLNLDINRLFVAEAYACQGPTLKRFRPRAQGRAYRIRKRSSHVTIIVTERI